MRRKRNGGEIPFCAGGEPERWEKLAFQRADRLAPAYRKLAGENGRDGGGNMRIDGAAVELIDLPGTYSLSARSPEEEVAAEYISFAAPTR